MANIFMVIWVCKPKYNLGKNHVVMVMVMVMMMMMMCVVPLCVAKTAKIENN
jgi:hypothetical protein